jgi:hypothetical protein
MIIRLDPDDSSILTQVAQYSTDPTVTPDMLESLLEGASPEAREIASVLLGQATGVPVREDVVETADYFRKWAKQNLAYASARMAAG